jgi:energy-coupling factor transport system substrate-specific component
MTRTTALPLGIRTTITLLLASVVGILAFTWPLILRPGSLIEHDAAAPVLLGAVVLSVMLIVIVELGGGGVDARTVALLGLLAAIGAVLRPLSAGSAGIELVFLFIVLGGRVFGPGFGFALGATTLFVSAVLTGGIGPWLPFQMLAASWFGMGAGLLPWRLRGGWELVMLAGYAAVGGFLYGQAMNLSFWPFAIGPDTALSFVAGAPLTENLQRFIVFSLATSLGWDLLRAIALTVGIAILGTPVLKALRRSARKAAFAPPETTTENRLSLLDNPNM